MQVRFYQHVNTDQIQEDLSIEKKFNSYLKKSPFPQMVIFFIVPSTIKKLTTFQKEIMDFQIVKQYFINKIFNINLFWGLFKDKAQFNILIQIRLLVDMLWNSLLK